MVILAAMIWQCFISKSPPYHAQKFYAVTNTSAAIAKMEEEYVWSYIQALVAAFHLTMADDIKIRFSIYDIIWKGRKYIYYKGDNEAPHFSRAALRRYTAEDI